MLNRGYAYTTIISSKYHGRTLLSHLASLYPHSTPQAWHQRLNSGEVTLNSLTAKRSLREQNGEEECNVFVAFSRAKKRVIITSVAERFGREQARTEVEKFFDVFHRAGVSPEEVS